MKKIKNQNLTFRSRGNHSCSLLIPEKYIVFFDRYVDKFGCTRKFLSYLLRKHLKSIGEIEVEIYSHYTIRYQEKNLDLTKINFYPNEIDWVQLKMLAHTKRVSIAHLFVLLFEIELGLREVMNKKRGVHEKNPRITLTQELLLSSIPINTRILHLRI